MRARGSAGDPLWYKDAIIYETHVKAFYDQNGDGVGDFRGLTEKLDYLQALGITCLWLLPFFPSPLRDDGYDIADYVNVHPAYGTLEDCQAFIRAAHERRMQVMVELVINHTSDAHPWFQAARAAPPGSRERDFYVWSDTDQRYREARIIFTDTEKSNWAWDPQAQAYYWHRFFSHQPDLNYDNPAVLAEVLRAMRFWLDLGVDGLRLDAVPYLVEREGTNCENLPETDAVIRQIRRELDAAYENRVLLAEANQWPADVRPYFGEGDACHMAFHFPLMPRIFMALRLEDRHPITEIMAQTPDIPASCQWGLFLRNHDELTLEMVTDEERDYMYLAYSADPRMRLNVGIRRRLAPLMDNNRRRMELMTGLLFSFPGTPIIYYGDEIGMGDNIYLGDRNGVRTPMQWTADRNAGFSRANPARLYSPLIMDPVYGYEAVNVEAQQSDPSSLLHWMRNMIALRKLFQVFGRGSLEFLHPENRKVLAYTRAYRGDRILCVANLSRFAQPVELDLSAMAGMVPVEMLGYTEFPAIGKTPYRLTLGPYGFLWFELQGTPGPLEIRSPAEEVEPCPVTLDGGWEGIFEERARRSLEAALPEFLAKQPWGRRTVAAHIADWCWIARDEVPLALLVVEADGALYHLPVAIAMGEAAEGVREEQPGAMVCELRYPGGRAALHDALASEASWQGLARAAANRLEIATQSGVLRAFPAGALDGRLAVKVFRRLQEGPHPEFEAVRFLSARGFEAVAKLAGAVEYERRGQQPATVAMLQQYREHQGDGWSMTLEDLRRYYEEVALLDQGPDAPAASREAIGIYLDSAATLGRRTAEMHLAFREGFPAEPFDAARTARELRESAAAAFDDLKAAMASLPDDVVDRAATVLSRRRALLERLGGANGAAGEIIRIHGNYHLGAVVRVENDFAIAEFTGARGPAPADVAAMLQSFGYAARSGLLAYTARTLEEYERLEPWARLWERWTCEAFVSAYRERAGAAPFLPQSEEGWRALLTALMLGRAFEELRRELRERSPRVRIPLDGILDLAG